MSSKSQRHSPKKTSPQKDSPQKDSPQKDSSQKGRQSEAASDRQSLPFEPKRHKPAKAEVKPDQPVAPALEQNKTPSAARIPDVVSQRMIRRMALLCAVPTVLGMATFIVSYLLVSQGWFKVPTYAVLLVSLGWFGLGVVGLSYGVLSASWDETTPGSLLGWTEFATNWGRMTATWRSNKKSSNQ